MDDRREHERYSVWFPISVATEAGEGIAISYDVSTGGLLMACPGRLETGASVEITFRVRADAPEQRIRGRVVRTQDNDPDGAWRYRIAVEFDHPVPELEAIVASAQGALTR